MNGGSLGSEIRKQPDLARVFADRGWKVSRDDTGMPSGERRIEDRVLLAILTKRSPAFSFEVSGWITTDALSAAYTLITKPQKRVSVSCPLANSPNFRIEKPVASDADVAAISDEWVNWGQKFAIGPALEALMNKDTNTSGDMPARHLSALAVSGNVDVLERYRDNFIAGDRMGFVPYITLDCINAAHTFAVKRQADPTWLPHIPRLRV